MHISVSSLTLLFCSILLLSCRSDGDQVIKTFYESGRVKEVIEVIDGSIPHGVYKCFYENGKIQEISHYVNGKLDGVRQLFHSSGHTEGLENYVNGKMNGQFKYFFDNGFIETIGNAKDGLVVGKALNFFKEDSGKVNIEAEFLMVRSESVRINYIQYDRTGDTIQASPAVKVELPDSIAVSSAVFARIKLVHPEYAFTHFVIKDFNDASEDVTINLKDKGAETHETFYKIDTSRKGLHYLRGIAIHHSITNTKDSLIVSEGELNIFFEKQYYVF